MLNVSIHNEYVEINSNLLVWYSRLTGTKGQTKAAAFYPFIFTTPAFNEFPEERKKAIIRHELIHFAQQKESLHVGFLIFTAIETIFLILKHPKKDSIERYLMKSTEQEAYFYMNESAYLKSRKPFAYLKFLTQKPVNADWLKQNYPAFYITEESLN